METRGNMGLKPLVVCRFDGYVTAYPPKEIRAGPYLKQWHYVYAEEGDERVAARFARISRLDQCEDGDCFQHGESFASLTDFLGIRGIEISQAWREDAQKEVDRRKAPEEDDSTTAPDPPGRSKSPLSE